MDGITAPPVTEKVRDGHKRELYPAGENDDEG